MNLEAFYPLPDEQNRWALLARPIGEVLLEWEVGPHAERFHHGAQALDLVSQGIWHYPTVARRLNIPQEDIDPAISYIANLYGTYTLPHTTTAAIEDHVLPITVINEPLRAAMPHRGWQLLELAAAGQTDEAIALKFERTVFDIEQMWEQVFAAMEIPPSVVAPAVAVRRSYEVGRIRRKPDSPVVVFSAPLGFDVSLTDAMNHTIDGYKDGLTRTDTGNNRGVTSHTEHTRRARLLRNFNALSMNEVIAKAVILGKYTVTPPRAGELPRRQLSPERVCILAGLALGYTVKEIGKHLNINLNTLKADIVSNIFPTLGVNKQGAAIWRAFQNGLFRVGVHPAEGYTPLRLSQNMMED